MLQLILVVTCQVSTKTSSEALMRDKEFPVNMHQFISRKIVYVGDITSKT